MRYPKGTVVISRERDIPLLRHVRNARFVSHQQLFELVELDGLGSCRSTFNWRVHRLLETGHIRRFEGLTWQGFPVYFITASGLAELENQDDCLLAMHSGRRQTADRGRAPHALQLIEIRLALSRNSLLADWRSEVEVSSENMRRTLVAGQPYAKNYDAIVKVWMGSEAREFALEYERSLKSAGHYQKIGEALVGEQCVPCVLYLTANTAVLVKLIVSLATPTQRVAFATAASFQKNLLDTLVAVDSNDTLATLGEFLRYAHPLYKRA